MDSFVAEDSPAGTILAAVALIGPLTAIAVAALVRCKITAFFLATIAGTGVIAGGILYSLHIAPFEGTLMAIAIFGGWSLALTFMASAFITAGRAALAARADSEPRASS